MSKLMVSSSLVLLLCLSLFATTHSSILVMKTDAATLQQDTSKAARVPVGAEQNGIKRTVGKVSHQYKKEGCKTVVLVKQKRKKHPLVLIPAADLPAALDVDGMYITFEYRKLKRPQPKGCTVGVPVEIKAPEKKQN